MANVGRKRALGDEREQTKGLPQPTMSFRRRAWLQFQRAIDPLARPKPLKIERH